MKTDRTVVRLLLLAGMVLATRSASAEPMGTAFTYQGQLKQGGVPVNHTCDFDVSLWTAEAGGTELGMQVVQTEVKNGLFTVKLNNGTPPEFGPDAFNGDARWLEIAVSCPAGGSFVPLGRQELTPGPYALFALNGSDGPSLWELNGTDIYYNGGNVGIGTPAPNRTLDVRGTISSEFTSGNNRNLEMKKTGAESPSNVRFTLSHRSSGTEAWMFGFDGTNFTNFQSWDAAAQQVRFPATGNTLVADIGTGRVGIGMTDPRAKLQIGGSIGNVFRDWMDNGMIVGKSGESDGGYFGLKDEGFDRQDTVIAWGDNSQDALRFIHIDVNGPADDEEVMRISADGNVGIGTDMPRAKLHVAGGNLLLDNDRSLQIKTSSGSPRSVLTMKSNDELWLYNLAGGPIRFSTYPAEFFSAIRLEIAANGNVGIGPGGASDTKLSVEGDIALPWGGELRTT